MKKLWSKLNSIMRSEQFLHAITMFSILVAVNQLATLCNINMPIFVLSILAILLAFIWEFAGKFYDAKYVSLDDIIYGMLGAIIMIAMFKVL